MNIEILASGSKGNCYKISNGNTSILIDAGISIKDIRKRLGFNLSNIDGVLISHEHGDHSKAVKDLVRMGQDVYLTYGTKNALALSPGMVNVFDKQENMYFRETIGDFIIQPFELVHDAVEPVGFIVFDNVSRESLVFITDTAYCKYKFTDFNYLMIEINHIKNIIDQYVLEDNLNLQLRNRIVENHMSLDTALGFLKACDLSNCKKIYIMHLSDSNSDEEFIKKEVQKHTGIPVEIC